MIVDLSQSWCHLVCQGPSNNHNVGLTGRSTENDTQTILVIPRGGKVHHFYGTAGKTKSHGPEGRLAGPVGDLIESSPELNILTLYSKHVIADQVEACGFIGYIARHVG